MKRRFSGEHHIHLTSKGETLTLPEPFSRVAGDARYCVVPDFRESVIHYVPPTEFNTSSNFTSGANDVWSSMPYTLSLIEFGELARMLYSAAAAHADSDDAPIC